MKARACEKRRYETEGEALAAARAAMRRAGTLPLGTYRCQTCRADDGRRYWHIGHKTSRARRLGPTRRRRQW